MSDTSSSNDPIVSSTQYSTSFGSNTHVATPPSDPFIGKTIGNCEILEKINEGGTSYIYRAHNARFELDRVVKILKPSLVGEEDFFTRFHQEAQLVARFDHSNIMRVYDTGQVGGYFYIEMEYITGQSLREYINGNTRISERDVLSIAIQIVSALEYAHTIKIENPNGEEIHGILHRDIKPENIMLTHGKLVKLMDFGAAKPLNITSNTMQGMIVGTFHYMSPEQLKGKVLDARSDFFSLGIVLYEIITGEKPFAAENLTELIGAIKTCKYKRIRSLRPSVSPVTEELIDKLLSRDPDHRPSSALEISEMLQHSLQSLGSHGTSKKVAIPFSLKRQFSSVALGASLLALLFSSIALWRSLTIEIGTPKFNESVSIPVLEKGRLLERKELWSEAVRTYKLVPSLEKGGLANEYLEAQIRMAAIYIKYQGQYNKARKVLEDLRRQYSDPSIDAYLGRAYFHLELYQEAQARFEAALKSNTGSVIPQTESFKKEILYYGACSVDARYQKEEQNEALLIETIKAWDYYIQFSKCDSRSAENECTYANKRRNDLAKLETVRKYH